MPRVRVLRVRPISITARAAFGFASIVSLADPVT